MAEALREQKLLTKAQVESNSDIKDAVTGEELLKGKVTALLFSASWCPPCSKFLPVLKSFYQELQDMDCGFEIVFVSLDHTKEEMDKYFTKYHGDWLALSFEDPFKESLVTKYNITAIPKLVVIRENGEVITLKGRKDVQDKGTSCFRSWLNNSIPKENRNAQQGETTQGGAVQNQGEVITQTTDISDKLFDDTDRVNSEIMDELIEATVYSEDQNPDNPTKSPLKTDSSSSPREVNDQVETQREATVADHNTREITTIKEETD